MDHLARIQQAVDFIEEHLSEEFAVEDVARRAGYSAWHFQRLFAATVGHGVMEYTRKRRLTAALRELGAGTRRILDIALDCGFESQEAFTRAFKAQFGITPGEARKEQVTFAPSLDKPKITMAYLDHLYRGISMEPKIVEREAGEVVGVGGMFTSVLAPGKDNAPVIPALWDSYLPRRSEVIGRVGQDDLGLVFPQAGTRGECFYLAGTETKPGAAVPAGMEKRAIAAGTYAVFTHKGKLDKLVHTMNFIHGSWLPKSRYTYGSGPEIEVYGERFDHASDESEIDIWIPVRSTNVRP